MQNMPNMQNMQYDQYVKYASPKFNMNPPPLYDQYEQPPFHITNMSWYAKKYDKYDPWIQIQMSKMCFKKGEKDPKIYFFGAKFFLK